MNDFLSQLVLKIKSLHQTHPGASAPFVSYHQVLKQPMDWPDDIERAKNPSRQKGIGRKSRLKKVESPDGISTFDVRG